jgi:hypothetical protein
VTKMRRQLPVVILLGLAACPGPADSTPQVHVIPGKAGVWGAIFAPTVEDASAPKPARIHVMQSGEQLAGPNAIGRPGDLVLENDYVVFVIDQLGSSSGFAESGGNIVDAADAKLRKDELGQMLTYFGVFPRQGVYDTLTTGTSPDASAWVQASGHELREPRLEVTTRYTLHSSDRGLLLATTLRNTGAEPIELASVGDAIEWGGAEKIAPGKPRGFDGTSSGPYVAGVGRFVSYAATSVDGSIEALSGSSWTDTAVRKGVALAPGEQAQYSRVFVVGERPDTSSLVAELTKATGSTSLGEVAIALTSGSVGPQLLVPGDARVAVSVPGGAEVMTIHACGDTSRLEAELPPGRWALSYLGGGGRAGMAPVEVEIKEAAAVSATIEVSAASSAHVACVETGHAGVPCKVTFERTDGAPPPDFGLPHVAGPARNQVTTADGDVDVALSPGAYRVTASRGPEYALGQASFTLAPGARSELRLPLKRVVDTAGYLACDFHQHTLHSADSPVALADRVIDNAAEGVELAVSTDHNDIADLRPFVQKLHLERELVSIPGDELTSDASLHPWGHANAFPLVFDPSKPRGGAPPVRDRAPGEVWAELRKAMPTDIVVQVNHPRSRQNGYFELLGFDPKTGVGTSPAYDASFDSLEVWNGRNVVARGQLLADLQGLLRTSHPVTAVADTDTHGIVGQEGGYPRTYVRVADDAHLDLWDTRRTDDVVRGIKTLKDVVLTNGPMLRVTANGAPIGGVARGRTVRVDVRLESAPWVVVEKVSVRLASGEEQSKPVSEQVAPSGAIAAHTSFTLNVSADDALVVIAEGSRPLIPVLGPESDRAILPWAMTGAIWIDADGDGRSLGRGGKPPGRPTK